MNQNKFSRKRNFSDIGLLPSRLTPTYHDIAESLTRVNDDQAVVGDRDADGSKKALHGNPGIDESETRTVDQAGPETAVVL